jgi:hypothetical protein
MKRTRHRGSWLRLLPLLPFVLSSLLPLGLMPAPSDNGLITFVICTPDGAGTRSISADQAPVPAEDDGSDNASAPCPFSLHAALAVLPLPLQVAEAVAYRIASPAIMAERPDRADAIVDPRPRGPPVLL